MHFPKFKLPIKKIKQIQKELKLEFSTPTIITLESLKKAKKDDKIKPMTEFLVVSFFVFFVILILALFSL